jgi:UDP-galactopyranose mutase
MLGYDLIVVGAGMTGATFARVKAEQYHARVLVIDQRRHIGGNCYDRYERGFGLVHMYGPHLFHTNSEKIVNFLSRFTDWVPYEHRVQVEVHGERHPMPVNMETIERLFPSHIADSMLATLTEVCNVGDTLSLMELKQMTEQFSNLVPLYQIVFEKIFRPYSEKQWGTSIDRVDETVLKRVPLRLSYDSRYFTDRFQALPGEGYTEMFSNMLDHPNIHVMTGTPWSAIERFWSPQDTQVFWTGSIDQLLDYKFGPLPYRSLTFSHVSGPALPVGTVNMPMDVHYTRVTDQSFINTHPVRDTHLLTYETPMDYDHTNPDHVPYYPVAAGKHRYEQYVAEAEAGDLPYIFGGRLGSFQYLNMDQACAQALNLAGYKE